MFVLITCLPRPYFHLACIGLCSHIFVAVVTCVEVLVVLCVWASSGSYPEACGHSALLCVCHKCMYEIFQGQNRQRGTLYFGISSLNVGKHFASKGCGLIVLEEGNAKTIFTGISLQDKGLDHPEKHVTNPGKSSENLICGGVQVPVCYFLPVEGNFGWKAREKGVQVVDEA